MFNVKTDPALLAALRKAAKQPISAEEYRRQVVSYVMSALKPSSTMTREQVERQIARTYGGDAAG